MLQACDSSPPPPPLGCHNDPVSTRTQQPKQSRWMRLFLAALVTVLATAGLVATASAATHAGPENRVRAHSQTVTSSVGATGYKSAGQRLGEAGPGPETTVATGVAAKTEAGLAGKICFVAGTQVLMADGTKKAIEDVRAGDLVMTEDPETGVLSPHRVKRLFQHVADQLYELKVKGGGSVKATPEHPFYVEGRGWTPIKDLRPGDQLRQPDGSTTEVGVVRALDEGATVYNFEVEAAHDYFVQVGDGFVLVHNVCDLDLEGVEHAAARHTWGGGQLTRDSSVFDRGVDLGGLSGRSAGQIGRIGKDGNIEYVIRGQDIVGVTGRSASNPAGTPTNIFTIVRDPYDGSLITMFPGTP